jgi:hypothetical protein
VLFKIELAFEGLVDGFDVPADGSERELPGEQDHSLRRAAASIDSMPTTLRRWVIRGCAKACDFKGTRG